MNKPIIECKNLTKRYSDGGLNVDVLKGVDLKVLAGERLAIIGASGSGKSTLLHLMGGLDEPTGGAVFVAGVDIHALSDRKKSRLRNEQLGFVYQFHHLLPEFNALENVCMPLLIRKDSIAFATQKASNLLEEVGLKDRIKHRVGELSGGERQRVAIARALVTDPVCVLADEPTGNLDHKAAMHIEELMQRLNEVLKISFVIVTHDMELAQKMDRQLEIREGVIVPYVI